MTTTQQTNSRIKMILAALLIALCLGCAGPPAIASAAPAAASLVTVAVQNPALAALPVKGRAPKTGYSRAQFGEVWADVDHNGHSTREDILTRDLQGVTFSKGNVATGTLDCPYTGKRIKFARGPASRVVEIDHVVSLSNAWQTGAQQLSAEERKAFANDPLNLLAVDGPTNQQKRDGDAATWLPSQKNYRAAFVARQIAVKAKYRLWVTPAEREAMERVLR